MLGWLKRFFSYRVYSQNGKFYEKKAWFLPAKEITKEQFFLILTKMRIQEFRLRPYKTGEYLSNIIKDIERMYELGVSPYGERVALIPVQVEEENTDKGFNLKGKWKCVTESGEHLHDLRFRVEGLTGPANHRGARPSEWIPLLFQLHMSGASATDEDFKQFREALHL
jgi:hypothetical protein